MSTPAERTANNAALTDVINLAAKRDGEAAQYLAQMAYAARILDDLYDGDRPVDQSQLVRLSQILLVEIHRQPFFARHRDYLTACHQIALNAWFDANEMATAPERIKQLYAHVLRDTINELAPAVAYLVGGWDHARAVSRVMREKFMKELD